MGDSRGDKGAKMTGAELDEWLEERGWSVIAFAREIGVSRKSVYFWLSGKNRIPGDVIERLPLLPREPGPSGAKRLQWPKPEIRIEGDAAYVRMVSGREAIVDASDVPLVKDFAWHSFRSRTTEYALHACTPTEIEGGLGKRIWMHHLILPRKEGLVPDHRDGNGLNNRRLNLRYATHAQNQQNRKPHRKKALPKGVTAYRGRYRAMIMANGETIEIGVYDTPGAAAAAYDRYALKLHGEFARPNNPAAKRELMDIIEDDDGYVPTEVVEPFEDGWSESRGGRGRRK